MHPTAAPHLAAVPAYVPGRSAETPAVALASNESPYGPSPLVAAALGAAIAAPARYPLDGVPALTAALAAHHGVDAAEIRVTNGATEAITLLCRAFAGTVVLCEGTFVAYARAAAGAERPVVTVPRRGWYADLDAMARAVGPDTGLLFLANPDNPTGTRFSADVLAGWLRSLPAHVVVVLDEAYAEYADGPDAFSLRGCHPNLVILRSFSKAHGLAALRVGFLAASRAIVDVVDRVRDPFNVNAVAAAGALAALRDEVHVARVAHANAAQRARLADALVARGHDVAPSAGNFLCVRVGDANAVAAALLAEGVAVRSLAGWGHADAIRVTVGTAAENARFLLALDAAAARLPRAA